MKLYANRRLTHYKPRHYASKNKTGHNIAQKMTVVSDSAPTNKQRQRHSNSLQQWLEQLCLRPHSRLEIKLRKKGTGNYKISYKNPLFTGLASTPLMQ